MITASVMKGLSEIKWIIWLLLYQKTYGLNLFIIFKGFSVARNCLTYSLHEKKKFYIKSFFSKCDQICRKLRIWSYLLKKSLMENFIFCAVMVFFEWYIFAKIYVRDFVDFLMIFYFLACLLIFMWPFDIFRDILLKYRMFF